MRQLAPSAVIGHAFAVYRDHFVVLFPIALGMVAIQAAVATVLVGDLVSAVVALLLSTILTILLQGIFVEVARDVEDGVLDSSFGQLLAAVLPAVVPLFLVGLVAGVLITVAAAFLIFPALYVLTQIAVVAPVTVLERPGVLAAFTRSRELVRGSGWQVLELVAFTLAITALGLAVVAIPVGAAGDVVSMVVSALVAPLPALVFGITYLRLRTIHGEAPLPSGIATADGPLARPGDEPAGPPDGGGAPPDLRGRGGF